MATIQRVGTGTAVLETNKRGKGATLVTEPEALSATVVAGDLAAATVDDVTLAAGPGSVGGPASAPASLFRTTVLPKVEVVGESAPQLVRKDRPRYQRQGLLGEGGVGEVVRTMDNDIERTVAIKRLKTDMRSASHLVRFVDEIRTIGSMEHPNIIPIHDVGVDEEGQYFFVMKYVQGDTLESILEKLGAGDPLYHARYGFERRVEIFMGVLEAIAYAHARGVIHRDIKPANVMVGPYGEVTVMDWGLARKVRDTTPEPIADDEPPPATPSDRGLLRTQVGTLLGTPAYMSPEQARGQTLDERSDIYSLSVMFHEMLCLQHYLHDAKTIERMLAGVVGQKHSSVMTVPSAHQGPAPVELAHFVNKGLEKDPAKRFPSVQAMIDRLRARAAGEIPIQCPMTFMKSVNGVWWRFFDRHPFGVMTTLMVSLMVMLSGTAWSVYHLATR